MRRTEAFGRQNEKSEDKEYPFSGVTNSGSLEEGARKSVMSSMTCTGFLRLTNHRYQILGENWHGCSLQASTLTSVTINIYLV